MARSAIRSVPCAGRVTRSTSSSRTPVATNRPTAPPPSFPRYPRWDGSLPAPLRSPGEDGRVSFARHRISISRQAVPAVTSLIIMLLPDHTLTAFDADLRALSLLIAEMGGLIEQQIVEAATALHNGNENCARRSIEMDPVVDDMQSSIEQKAADIIACYQPVAVDL